MDWNEFAQEVHQAAVEHGWWDKPLGFAEIAVMCHSELSEAVEEYRAGNRIRPNQPTPMIYYSGGGYVATAPTRCCTKPEGVAVELADCIIRILDYLASEGADIGAVKPEQAYDGDTIRTIARCHYLISLAYIDDVTKSGGNWIVYKLKKCIKLILGWAEAHDVDMESVLRAKHEYNKGRSYRHGGKLL